MKTGGHWPGGADAPYAGLDASFPDQLLGLKRQEEIGCVGSMLLLVLSSGLNIFWIPSCF